MEPEGGVEKAWLSKAFHHMLICNSIPFPGLLEGTNKIIARKELCKVKSAVHVREMIITLCLWKGSEPF